VASQSLRERVSIFCGLPDPNIPRREGVAALEARCVGDQPWPQTNPRQWKNQSARRNPGFGCDGTVSEWAHRLDQGRSRNGRKFQRAIGAADSDTAMVSLRPRGRGDFSIAASDTRTIDITGALEYPCAVNERTCKEETEAEPHRYPLRARRPLQT